MRSAGFRCMQLHVDAARWEDSMLAGWLTRDGAALTGPEVREHLHELKRAGHEVVPCAHRCDAKGRCQGSNTTKGGERWLP